MKFSNDIFEVFNIKGLDNRMNEIRKNIQPLFLYYSKDISNNLNGGYVHVAKHLRRFKYEPESTWVAIGGDKKGYKKYPHFQIGINKEYIFICLALIDNPLYEKEMLEHLLLKKDLLNNLPNDFIVIQDHTKLNYLKQNEFNYEDVLNKAIKNKKYEFMLGRLLKKEDKILSDESETKKWMLDTVSILTPFYNDLLKFYDN